MLQNWGHFTWFFKWNFFFSETWPKSLNQILRMFWGKLKPRRYLEHSKRTFVGLSRTSKNRVVGQWRWWAHHFWVPNCPSRCCRNVQNSTIFRKLRNGFLSTPKVFCKLFWAFRHLRSPFWPFLCIFGSPESPRKLIREAPKCRFETPTGGKMV